MIYIYLGKSKAHTMSVQKQIYANKGVFWRQGYLFPSYGLDKWAHDGLLIEEVTNKSVTGQLTKCCNQITRYKASHADGNILFTMTLKESIDVDKFKPLFTALSHLDEVKVIVHLQEQLAYLKEAWSRESGLGLTELPFISWALEAKENPKLGLDYKTEINKLESIIPTTNIKVFFLKEPSLSSFFSFFYPYCGIVPDKHFFEFQGSICNPFPPLEGQFPKLTKLFQRTFAKGNDSVAKKYDAYNSLLLEKN